MHGAHITLEGDQHKTEEARVERVDVASTPVHVAPDPALVAAELRKVAELYARRLGWPV
jgi:hypothetical protein